MSGSQDLPFLFVPDWAALPAGQRVSLVVTRLVWEQSVALGNLSPSGQVVRLSGLFPAAARSCSCVTVLGATFLSRSSLLDLALDHSSKVLCHGALSVDRLSNYVEVCAGVGLSAIGFTRVGFRHVCAVELQPKLAELHRSIHPGVEVVCADITQDSTAGLVFDRCPNPGVVMAGIACQPYSRGGSQQGGLDSRSLTLPGTLRFCHLVQAPILVLECVAPAAQHAYVQDHIRALQVQLGYNVVEFTMKLENVWAACRHRWWVVATLGCRGPVRVPPYPDGSTLCVRDLMPYVRQWTQDAEDQLALTNDEQEKFQLGGQLLKSHVVKPDQKLSTALHSWGGQIRPCACECRPQGFSDQLLTAKGVYAQLIQKASGSSTPAFRHMHVQEVALLNGVPLDLQWGHDERLNLCAIGQMAAPMQAIWIAGAIRRHVQLTFGLEDPLDLISALQDLKQVVLTQSKDLWPAIPSAPTEQLLDHVIEIHEPFRPCKIIRCSPVSRIRDLLQAETREHGQAPQIFTWDHTPLQGDELVSTFSKLQLLRHDQVMPDAHMEEPEAFEMVPFDADDMPDAQVRQVASTQMDEPVAQVPPSDTAMQLLSSKPTDVQDAAVATVMTMNPDQLVALLPPLVVDQDLCNSLRNQVLSKEAREQLLQQQGTVWADDEIWWHLMAIPHVQDTVFLDPMLASSWLTAGTLDLVHQWISLHNRPNRIVSVVLKDGHWIPCIWTWKVCTLTFQTWEHDSVDLNGLNVLHGLFCRALGLTMFNVSCTRRGFGLRHCGAAAVLFLMSRLCGDPLPSTDLELDFAADSLRNDFKLAHGPDLVMSRPWCWGAGVPDLHAVLATLLQSHGVPSAASTQRARLIIQSLGKDEVQSAMHGVAPWKSLKHLANQHMPRIQLVLPDELNAVVNDRKVKQPNKGARKPKNVAAPTKPLDIDPSRLSLVDHTFCTGNDVAVAQIPLSQVGPLNTGLALVTYNEAKPFLLSGELLTQRSLALLVVNGPDELQTDLQWSSIRFAATCLINQQPVLLSGFLVQLGAQVIYPYTQTEANAVSDVPVACARITVHKDQWPQAWDQFAEHPFRNVLSVLPPLQACRQDGCSCTKWHPDAMDSATDVVLDVFRRQFFTETGRPTKAAHASHFGVQVRYLKSQELKLLQLSGQNGVYIEPRIPDATAPSGEFQVVWMPQLDFSSAQHRSQCEPLSIGLARSGRRFGIRVRALDFQKVFAQLRPDGHFLAPGTRQLWHCGPWPYGSDRKSLAKVFSEWQWQARPLQPSKPVNGGMMWLIQSIDDPSQVVWNMKHGQVVVSRCSSVNDAVLDSAAVLGPQATVDLCTSTSPMDPWLERDPWQQAVKTVPTQAPSVAHQLHELESRLEKSLLDKLPPERMDTDEQENRLSLLEQQMQHLAHRHQTLETTVNEHHQQNQAQVQSLQAQMVSQMEVQRSHMAGMFEDQMQKLETILSKRGRHE